LAGTCLFSEGDGFSEGGEDMSRNPVMGEGVLLWSEFKALALRLGMNYDPVVTRAVAVHIEEGEPVVIRHEHFAEDCSDEAEAPSKEGGEDG
jgi:hypothetical protein